jgi:hypothetical protein
MTGYVGAGKQSFPDTRHPDEPYIQVSSLHKMKVPAAFYENKFRPQPISLPYPHPVSTNHFPIHYPSASQNDSKVQPSVYAFFWPPFVEILMTIHCSSFFAFQKQKPCHIIRDRAW